MRGIKDEREESDGEEMEHDSGDSDKSSSSCESSDAASDSDDSSEMDFGECERRRVECMDKMAELEKTFTSIREQLYRERMAQVELKLSQVKVGKAQEYLQPLEELENNMRIRIDVAGILKSYKMDSIQNNFNAEEQAARQNFESEKSLLWDSIREDLEDKIRRLEEDRNSVDINADLWLSERGMGGGKGGKLKGAQWRRGGKEMLSRRKPVTVTGPYVVYMLSDPDILEDWTTVKKALSVCKIQSELI